MMIVLAGMRMGTNKMRIQCLACGTTAELGPASSHRQELGTVERSPSQDAIDTFMSMHHLHKSGMLMRLRGSVSIELACLRACASVGHDRSSVYCDSGQRRGKNALEPASSIYRTSAMSGDLSEPARP